MRWMQRLEPRPANASSSGGQARNGPYPNASASISAICAHERRSALAS